MSVFSGSVRTSPPGRCTRSTGTALLAGFVLRRIKRFDMSPSPTAVGDQDASERPYSRPYRLSEYQPEQFPEVIICAAANISDYGATPSGSHVTSFTFSSKWIGGPVVGAQLTEVYERAVGDRAQARFTTLPTAMSISGAAFSPSMGKMTHAPFRFFLALANLRLGVWVPNPRRLDKFVGRGFGSVDSCRGLSTSSARCSAETISMRRSCT